MAMRNIVCISDLPPDAHEWAKTHAKVLTKERGKRTTMSDVVVEALTLLKQRYDDEQALEQAKANRQPWVSGDSAD